MLAKLKSEYQESPDSIDTNNAIAEYYLNNGMEDEAKPYLIKMLEIDEGIISAHNQLGVIYFKDSQYNEAEQHFRKALQLDFSAAEVHFNLAFLYQSQGKFLQALPYYKQAINSDTEDSDIFHLMGQCARDAEMLDDAESLFEEAFRLSSSAETAIELSMLYITAEKYPEAEDILKLLLDMIDDESKNKPKQSNQLPDQNLNLESLNFALGLVLAKQGKYMNAIKHLRYAVMADDQNEQAYNYLGECCAAIGLDKEAESFLSKASKIDPQYLQPIMNLGKIYYDQGQYQKTVAAIERYLAVKAELSEISDQSGQSNQDPDAEIMYELLGMAYQELGHKGKALEIWRESLSINPNQPRIILLMKGAPSPVYRKTSLSIDD